MRRTEIARARPIVNPEWTLKRGEHTIVVTPSEPSARTAPAPATSEKAQSREETHTLRHFCHSHRTSHGSPVVRWRGAAILSRGERRLADLSPRFWAERGESRRIADIAGERASALQRLVLHDRRLHRCFSDGRRRRRLRGLLGWVHVRHRRPDARAEVEEPVPGTDDTGLRRGHRHHVDGDCGQRSRVCRRRGPVLVRP